MYIQLKELIEALEQMPQDGVVPHGFGKPGSYRGDYAQLAFEPVENAVIGDMLSYAKSALGSSFDGYKGGRYTMCEYTDCYIASDGNSGGDMIGPTLIGMWRHHLGV